MISLKKSVNFRFSDVFRGIQRERWEELRCVKLRYYYVQSLTHFSPMLSFFTP